MSLPRGLKPTAGVVLGLGLTGCVVVAFDADSEARRRAEAWRRQVLTTALRRRLHSGDATVAPPAQLGSPAVALGARFYVVTGPDEHLTSLGRERVSRALLRGQAGALQLQSTSSDGSDEDHDEVCSRRPARLAVPYDLTLGTGQFSSLVEQQLLRSQRHAVVEDGGDHGVGGGRGDHGGSEHGARDGMRIESGEPESDGAEGFEERDQHRRSHGSPRGNTAGQVKPEEDGSALSPPPATRATPIVPSLSAWESLVLRATVIVLDGQQLDDAALWALESALSEVESRCDHDNNKEDDREGPSLPAGPNALKSCNFVLEVRQAAATEDGAAREESGQGALCDDLARLGWRVASLGLGSVVVSSSNPWILAELQETLRQHPAAERKGRSKEGPEDRSEESSDEVVIVRVALPSAADRKDSVLAVARDLGVDDRLSAVDVSMLEDVTGGRRAELLDVLERVKHISSGVTTVQDACQAAVEHQARALAATWGLLSHDKNNNNISGDSGASDHEAITVAAQFGASNNGGDGGRAERGGEARREDWAPLWEAMAMLSVPLVSVGVAGASSALSPPPGSVHPAQLLEECALDGETLLRLTREGWLELSPAAPPGSGTILEHPDHPQLRVTVHLASTRLDSLSRGVDRSFVGAPPLRLAAFRRLLDHRGRSRHRSSLTTPPSSNTQGVVDGRRKYLESTMQQVLGYGGGMAYGVEEGEGKGGAGEHESHNGGLGDGESADAGCREAGQVEQQLELGLERAGYLIEASVLRRDHARQSALLSQDAGVLASNWAELGTARRDLQRAGKDDDTSDGEWAEVQLELIRQERAVVARALEMRARRARVDGMRRDILSLERSAGVQPPSRPEQATAEEKEVVPAAPNTSGRTVGLQQGPLGVLAEEMVLRDAERGVRLMPLLATRNEKGDGGREDGGDIGGGTRGRGVGVGRWWRWLRGW